MSLLLRRDGTPVAAVVVGQHAPCGAVQPQPSPIAVGNVVEATPGHQKRVGHNVSGVGRLLDSPQRVSQNQAGVLFIEPIEARPARLGPLCTP